MRALDLTLLTDLYELTMMQGYFKTLPIRLLYLMLYRQNPCDLRLCHRSRPGTGHRIYP